MLKVKSLLFLATKIIQTAIYAPLLYLLFRKIQQFPILYDDCNIIIIPLTQLYISIANRY